jgi:hypothetical protein
VHLAGPDPAVIVLGDRPPATAYLVQGSHRVTAWKREAGRVTLALSGIGEKVVELGGLGADRELAVEIRELAGSRRLAARTDPDGRLTVRAGDADPVELRVG